MHFGKQVSEAVSEPGWKVFVYQNFHPACLPAMLAA